MMATALRAALLLATVVASYKVPNFDFMFFHEGGFKAFIPAPSPLASQFTIQGTVEGGVNFEGIGERVGNLLIYQNDAVRVREGDTLRYWVLVRYDDFGYANTDLKKHITKLVPSNTSIPDVAANLKPTVVCPISARTQYSLKFSEGAAPCVGQVVFEDQFDDKYLNTDNWMVEVTLPSNEEAEFVSYQESAVTVDEGKLVIFLKQFRDENELRNGNLKLAKCFTGRCETSATKGSDILPPYVSGKITTKQSFNFKYGKVEIRAKLPAGDWIYPQLYLRPQTTRNGDYYDFGEMRIATARGNKNLSEESRNYGNSVLYGGVVLNITDNCPRSGLATLENIFDWADMFHTYVLEWSPDEIKVSADGKVYGTINRHNKYSKDCNGMWDDKNMKPFDKKFYLSIGLAVGGLTEFPDNVGGKPWKDTDDSKPMMKFWNNRAAWHKTWGKHSRLLIDYVKVTAM